MSNPEGVGVHFHLVRAPNGLCPSPDLTPRLDNPNVHPRAEVSYCDQRLLKNAVNPLEIDLLYGAWS